MSEETQEVSKADKLAKLYRKMYEAKKDLTAKYEEDLAEIEKDMKQVKDSLLELCKEIGADSIRTQHGTVVRSVKEQFTCTDWHEFSKFVKEHDALDLMQKRISVTNMRTFLEENPDLHPPGLNIFREFTVEVRKPR